MSGAAEVFLDTNIVLYLLSRDDEKADRAEEIVARGGVVSVQVLNEFTSVATRKLGMRIAEAREVLAAVRSLCKVVLKEQNTPARSGAQTVLTWLDTGHILMRGSQREATNDQMELLRTSQDESVKSQTSTLLRVADKAQGMTEQSVPRRMLRDCP